MGILQLTSRVREAKMSLDRLSSRIENTEGRSLDKILKWVKFNKVSIWSSIRGKHCRPKMAQRASANQGKHIYNQKVRKWHSIATVLGLFHAGVAQQSLACDWLRFWLLWLADRQLLGYHDTCSCLVSSGIKIDYSLWCSEAVLGQTLWPK